MDDVLIIGAGGHAREIAYLLKDINKKKRTFSLKGFIDDDPELKGKEVIGLPVTDSLENLLASHEAPMNLIMGIGNPSLKRSMFQRTIGHDIEWPNIIHPSARIVEKSHLGKGIVFFPNCVISTETDIGDFTCFNTGVSVSHDSRIGRFTTINPGCFINGEVRVGDCAYIGSSAVIINRVTVGDYAIIGAGAVVIKDIPQNTTSVGNPSKVIKVQNPGGK